MRTHRRLAIAATMVLGLAAGSARGQGTQGAVPDPVSSRDLARWSLRLELSAEQQEAIGRQHELYLAEFRALREGDIEALLQKIGGMFMGGFRNLQREQIEAATKANDRVMSQIRAIDDRFLESMRGVLTEEQASMLPRISDARARERYSTGATQMVGRVNQAARVDLADLYEDLELTAPDRQASEPLVIQYEGRLTSLSRELYEAAAGMFLAVSDAMQAQGIDMANMQNLEPAERGRMMQSMGVVWSEATAKPREQAHKISDLNRRTMRELSAALSQQPADQLQGRYLRRAYSEVPRARAAERSLRMALQLEGLPSAKLDEIEGLDTTFRAQRGALVDEMVEYLDGYRRDAGINQFMGPGRQTHRDRLDAFRERFERLDESTVASLRAMLGPDGTSMLEGALASRDRGDDDGRGGRPDGAAVATYTQAGPDPFVPRPISAGDVAGYRKKLGFADDERFILESLHEDYLASWAGIRDTDVVALQKGHAVLRRTERRDNDVSATPADVAVVYDLRRRIVATVIALDRAFFDDLETIISTDQQRSTLGRLRRERETIVYNRGVSAMEEGGGNFAFGSGDRGGDRGDRGGDRGPGQGGPPGPGGGGPGGGGPGGGGRLRPLDRGQESSVDVATITAGLELGEEARTAVEVILDEYQLHAMDAFRMQYETILRLREEADLRRFQPREEGQDGRQRWEAMREVMEASRAQMAQASDPVVALNRATVSRVSGVVTPEQASSLKRAYNRWAYPQAFDESRAAGRFLDAARLLPELNADQGKRLDAIIGEYRASYEATCEKLVDLYIQGSGAVAMSPEFWRSTAERRGKVEMLEFDRDEANLKAIRQLRAVLDEQQQARIGLPEPQRGSG